MVPERRVRRAVLVFAAVAPFIAALVWSESTLAAIGVVFFSHMLILYPTLRPASQWLGPVVTRFETDAKAVWLTVDDGPHPDDTLPLLDLLERHHARATFFVKGALVRQYPQLARTIVDRGHAIANHSDTHPSGSFWCLGPGRIALEIDGCNTAILAATGRTPGLFRAPVGMKNPFVHPIVSRRGMRLVAWSTRGFDAVMKDRDAIVARILRDVRPGSIILAHQDTPGGPEQTLGVIEAVLLALEKDGFTFVIPPEESLVCGGTR